MTVVNTATGEVMDRILDALDDAPLGIIEGEESYQGRLATIQHLAAALGCSDTTARSAVMDLSRRGLVYVCTAVDPTIRKRRIFVSGGGL